MNKIKRIKDFDSLVSEKDFNLIENISNLIDFPKKYSEQPDIILVISPGRSGSTALLAWLTSSSLIDYAYYQPIKSLIRHGDRFGKFIIPSKKTGIKKIVIKTTVGPYNNLYEQFDPKEVLTNLGYKKEKIKTILLLRDPIETFISNFKFSKAIKPSILIENIHFISELSKKYPDSILLTLDLFSKFGVEKILKILSKKLKIKYEGVDFNMDKIHIESKDCKINYMEGSLDSTQNEIVLPTIEKNKLFFENKPTKKESLKKIDLNELIEVYDCTKDVFNLFQFKALKCLGLD